jgi:cellulose biosynthesis protein BcsQ
LEQIRADLRGRYEVHDYLGRGAYATVWQAYDAVSRELVAVKRFNTRPHDRRSFYRELRVMFRLIHPRVVRIINLVENVGTSRYLILEHCAGGSLRSALGRAARAGRRCPLDRIASIARHLAEGLASAHDLGLVHRDLKPENVLFDSAEPTPFAGHSGVKLADFGLARALQHAGLGAGATLRSLSGSPAYMAPEQFAGQCTAATDFYALGVILYELFHGGLPFEGTPEALAYHHLRSTPYMDAGLPMPWRNLLSALLHKDPAQRPDGRHLIAALAMDNPVGEPLHPAMANPEPKVRPAKPYVLAITGARGGGGRTTTAAALAWCWAHNNCRVALHDADPVSAVGMLTTIPTGESSWPNIRLVDHLAEPSMISTDVVIVDCPRLSTPTARAVLHLADGFLLLSQADALSLRTSEDQMQALDAACLANPRLAFLGVLLARFESGDRIQRHVRNELRSRYGSRLLDIEIPQRPELRAWPMQPGSDLPAGPGRDAYQALAKQLTPNVCLRCNR